jgi:ubiquinone/menaquinone biosynthesis C-methylase UbiE
MDQSPDAPDDSLLRLLGSVAGKRVLELGCGTGHAAVAFAKQGARVIAVDESEDKIAAARRLADREDVRLELHNAPLAELAFVRADTIDSVYSAHALAAVDDIERVFRQVHRVLRPERPFVLSLPHPATALELSRSYWDRTPLPSGVHPRTISELFTGLSRANFRVDHLLEPEEKGAMLPAVLIIRARKQGL